MDRRQYLATCGLLTFGSLSGCTWGPFGGDGATSSQEGDPTTDSTRRARTGDAGSSGTASAGTGRSSGGGDTDATGDTDAGGAEGTDSAETTDGAGDATRTETRGNDGQGDPSLPNRLRIVHTGGRRVFYEVGVSGTLVHGWNGENPTDHQDAIHDDRTRLSGSVVENDEDEFAFDGRVVTFAIDGPADARVDGDRITSDTSSLGAALGRATTGTTTATATTETGGDEIEASAAEAAGIVVREHRYREFSDRRDVVAVTLENGTANSIGRAAIYVAFYRNGEYRFGTNAYSVSDLAPGATDETTPERPFEDVSVEEYQVFVASTRHDTWVPGTERASL